MLRASLLCFVLLVCAVYTVTGRPDGASNAANTDDYLNEEDYDYDEEEQGVNEPATPAPPPVIVSKPESLNVKPGTTVYLPCDIRDLSQTYAVLWQNGSKILYSDNNNLAPHPRVHKFDNYTLQIKDVQIEDSGYYSCTISSVPQVQVIHQLSVPSPARIEKLSPDAEHRTIQLGAPLTLECIAVGHPEPQVTWTKPGSVMPGGKKQVSNSVVNIAQVTRDDAGSYECVASNGMGDNDVRKIAIHVQYGPRVTAVKQVVNSELGYESELQCQVDALPAATVSWARNGKPVTSGGHVKIDQSQDLHTLRITKTRKEDFATYTCVANNPVASQTAVIQLTGTPSIAQFITANSTGNSATLQWVIESHAPISEYTLRFRKKKTNEWLTEKPVVEDVIGNQYRVSHTLTNLAPGDYEAQLSSKNSYGLSKESASQYFTIKDYGEAAQSKVEATKSPGNNAVDTRPITALLASLLCLSLLQ